MKAIEFDITNCFRTKIGFFCAPIFIVGNKILTFQDVEKKFRFSFKEFLGSCSSREYSSFYLGIVPNNVKVVFFQETFNREIFLKDKEILSSVRIIIPDDLSYFQLKVLKKYLKKNFPEKKEEVIPSLNFKGIKYFKYEYIVFQAEKSLATKEKINFVSNILNKKIYVK